MLGSLELADLQGLSLGELEDRDVAEGYKGEDDGEDSVRPSPVVLVEPLSNLGTGISTDNPWRSGEGVGEASVAEGRGVGGGDVDGEDDTDKADRVEALPSARNLGQSACAVVASVQRM